ncbi:vWA domain-containing protein [Verrucosispora sp. TAA-831]|uniref:vWA domain-containing protein n=1 Tax=Verrucosispora sp. TAA-831 TaxID=3422227 RepID=UPI003D6E4095
MSKPITFVLLVTDMSGSMGRLADDVRGGFNSYVAGLREDTDREYRLSVTLFDDEFMPLCTAAPLAEVPTLDAANYRPRGMTALLDAVGKTILGFDTSTLGGQDRVLVVVQTDGAENSSKEFRSADIADLIRQREATGQWSFVFLGAGPETWQQAHAMGFDRASTVAMDSSAHTTRGSYSGLTTATRSYSRGGSAADTVATLAAATGGHTVAADSSSPSDCSPSTTSYDTGSASSGCDAGSY